MLHLPRKRYRAANAAAILALALCVSAVSETARDSVSEARPTARVTAVRFWSLGDVTRIAVEASGELSFHYDRVPNPDRLFFDFPGTTPVLQHRGVNVIPVHDDLLKQIRVAETQHGVTRLVLDLVDGSTKFTTETLANPDRLIIELRNPAPKVAVETAPVPKAPEPKRVARETAERVLETSPIPSRPARVFTPPPDPVRRASVPARPRLLEPPSMNPATSARPNPILLASLELPPPPVFKAKPPERETVAKDEPPVDGAPRTTPPSDVAYPARRPSTGVRSMTRVLGLKVNRIVIDAGHGGHDTGTIGPTGLREKDLVLDVALRVGKLIEDRMGAQVIYTRDDDRFIPLQERTAIANANQADLFLSIHANSSPERTASGVETYYLNFTTSRDALDVAARENADSTLTVNDLQSVLQKIALKDKVDESREFALRVQTALSATARSSRNRDRGVRKAPFVVLIGATMPSVLSEIGFVSNPQDERQMKRPETRQKIAEALYKGLSQYASSLSHFQVAEQREVKGDKRR
ncbi:MAG TPA: N-acetylmuramoyl-L-alanine amidase [Bryobacteraceae bacterium]|nr:N-acetylmuramoyl-L-alanine amidase [Bryobacteraceae bacterium]